MPHVSEHIHCETWVFDDEAYRTRPPEKADWPPNCFMVSPPDKKPIEPGDFVTSYHRSRDKSGDWSWGVVVATWFDPTKRNDLRYRALVLWQDDVRYERSFE